MALNKAQTSLGIKIVLIFLIIAFVASFIPFIGGAFDGGGDQQPAQGALERIGQQFQPTVSSLTSLLASEPESYTVLVTLGNTYFDWANEIQKAAQTDATLIGADQPYWVAAKDAYRRALAIKDDEPPVVVDYAITAHYTGETSKAIEAASRIAKANPDFAPAFFNLGIFYKALGKSEDAVAAFRRYLELDPEGEQGDATFAKNEIASLTGQSAPPTTAP